ncbi:hypothetical protein ACHWQZ_G017952 [Mnemiopsis leidyi]
MGHKIDGDVRGRGEGSSSIFYNSIIDDLFTIFHWMFLPSIILLIMYSEMQDNAERWVERFEVNGKRVPNDVPAKETLLTFSLVSLVLYGVSAYMLWRRCGGLRKNYISLAVWEVSIIAYFVGFGIFFDTSEVAGGAAMIISCGLSVLNFIFFLQHERRGALLQIPYIGWTFYLSFCALRIINVEEKV